MIRLISSMATREVIADLAAQFESATGQQVALESRGGVDVANRVRAGLAVDLVVLAADTIDQLIQEEKLLAGSRVDLVNSGVALAIGADAEVPDISSEDLLKQAVLEAKTLGYSTGPSGVHLEKLFVGWGIFDTIKPRIVQAPSGVSVGSLVASGAVALGFQQLSELVNLAGIVVVGPLPGSTQIITTFSAGISTHCKSPESARAFAEYMATPATAASKRKQGMEPA